MFNSKILNNASGAIALLFRNIINNNNLTGVLDVYIDMRCDRECKNSQEKSALKTNYNTHINKGQMTVKIFIKLFKELFNVKYMAFTISTKYKNKIVEHKEVLDLKEKNDDVVYLLLHGLLEKGLNEDLGENLTSYIKNNPNIKTNVEMDKEKYTQMSQINCRLLTWKKLVDKLNDIFQVEYIKLSVNIEYGKKGILEEIVSIRLRNQT